MILCILFFMLLKFIWVTLIQKQQKNKKVRLWILGVGAALYYDLKYNRKIQVLKEVSFPGILNMQVLCPYYVKKKKNHMKVMLHWQMCGCICKIWAQWIDYKTSDKAFISYIFLLLFRLKSKCGCPISSKITKLYFISNIYTVTQRLKDYLKFCTTTELSL